MCFKGLKMSKLKIGNFVKVVDKYNEILDCMVEIYNEIHYPE